MIQPLTLLAFLYSTPVALAAGGDVGNGGDAIECRASAQNPLRGVYALDYILTLPGTTGSDGATPVSSWPESSARIQRLLSEKAPALADSFREFSRLIYNTNYAEPRVWEPAPFGLLPLHDENITSLLPENCAQNGVFNIMQAVIRQYENYSGTKPGRYIYKFFPEVLRKLSGEAPLQFSFLMVHEWLWDFSANVDRNRRINRFLHSRLLDTLSPADVITNLEGMGLEIPPPAGEEFMPELWRGEPLTEQRFLQKFGGRTNGQPIGALKVNRRENILNCSSSNPDCHPGWRPSNLPFILSENRFVLTAPAKNAEDRGYPLKLVNLAPPESGAMSSEVRGDTEIECRFVTSARGNLECRFARFSLIPSTFLGRVEREPRSGWPTLHATITETSFRMIVPLEGNFSFRRKKGKETWEGEAKIETSFTARFR